MTAQAEVPGVGAYDAVYQFGPAFSGMDVHAFVTPTYKEHEGVYSTPDLAMLEHARESKDPGPIYQAMAGSDIPNLAGVSVSTHRDKYPVVTLGRINPHGFVGSNRTVAGSILFWLTDRSPISGLLSPKYAAELYMADELPPFDLFLTFINEAANWSSMVVQGMTILDEGKVIEQAGQEGIVVTYSYMAMSTTPIMPGFFSVLPPSDRSAISSALTSVTTKQYKQTSQWESGLLLTRAVNKFYQKMVK